MRHPAGLEQVQTALAALDSGVEIKATEVFLTDGGLVVLLRCGFPAQLALLEVHTAMARLERALRRSVPDILRVQIEPEPLSVG